MIGKPGYSSILYQANQGAQNIAAAILTDIENQQAIDADAKQAALIHLALSRFAAREFTEIIITNMNRFIVIIKA